MTTRSLTVRISLLLALAAFSASAQTPIPFDVEVGYRWNQIGGNRDLFRTQINERSGFLIRSFSMFTTDFGGATTAALDHFRIDASDLGVGPSSTLRIDAGKSGSYRLRVGFRSVDAYSALPAFANPFLASDIPGTAVPTVLPGQHTYDRQRTMLDADIELLRSSTIVPFIGFSTNRNNGPGTSTYFLGQDEFLLGSDLDETSDEFRVGAGFTTRVVSGSITQGWRKLRSDESFTLRSLSGNNLGTILGRDITATSLTRNDTTTVDAPFTNAYLMTELIPRVRLIGEYVRFDAESDGDETEESAGSFASFGFGRFFDGLTENVASAARNDTWRGGLRGEFSLTNSITLLAGYDVEHREQSGVALINSILRNSVTFGGGDRRDFTNIVNADSRLDRDESIVSAELHARPAGPFSFRVALRQASQDITSTPDLSEIVVPGNQGGDFERQIDTLDGTVTFTQSLLSVAASYRLDRADEIVLRTDFNDRDRARVRAGLRTPNNMASFGVTAERSSQTNDVDDVGLDADTTQYIADFQIAPIAPMRLRASYSRHDTQSRVNFRRPESFVLETSVHEENGDSIEGGINVFFKPVTLDASVGRFENEGTLPFTFDRYRVRLGYDFAARFGVAGEWAHDRYEENVLSGQFDADRFGVFLRYRR